MSIKQRDLRERCPFRCPVCDRACTAATRQNHRFDCHGHIAAHAIENGRWVNITNPAQRGYLIGPSKTSADDPLPGVLIRIGRARTFHRARVAIREMKVIVVTRCGIDGDTTSDGYTETFGIPTCQACIDRDQRRDREVAAQ